MEQHHQGRQGSGRRAGAEPSAAQQQVRGRACGPAARPLVERRLLTLCLATRVALLGCHRPVLHRYPRFNVMCTNCHTAPLRSAHYRCSVCRNYALCERCYRIGAHGFENAPGSLGQRMKQLQERQQEQQHTPAAPVASAGQASDASGQARASDAQADGAGVAGARGDGGGGSEAAASAASGESHARGLSVKTAADDDDGAVPGAQGDGCAASVTPRRAGGGGVAHGSGDTEAAGDPGGGDTAGSPPRSPTTRTRARTNSLMAVTALS